jgi:ABC-type enterochelin transport system substrate-binding protein
MNWRIRSVVARSYRPLAAVVLVTLLAALSACTSQRRSASHAQNSASSAHTTASASNAKPPNASVEVEANKARLAVKLQKKSVVHVVLPPVDESNGQPTTYGVQPAGTNVLRPVPGFPGFFAGAEDGTSTVVVHQPCAPGKACASQDSEIGSVVVTVSG